MTGENPPPQNTKDRPEEWLPVEESSTWHEDGLRFECQACGKCCHNHGEGYAFAYSSRPERISIAKNLHLSLKALEEKYCERVTGGWSFKSRGDACIFLDKNNQCSFTPCAPLNAELSPSGRNSLRPETGGSEMWHHSVSVSAKALSTRHPRSKIISINPTPRSSARQTPSFVTG